MSELLAENRFVLDQELFTEGMLRTIRSRAGRTLPLLLIFLGLAWLALTGWTLARGEGSLLLAGLELLVVLLLALWAAVWMPRRKATRAWRGLEARGAADTERVTRFYGDRLEVDAGGQRTSVDYGELEQILQSKNLLIFLAGNGTGILVKRDGFTRGSEAELLQYLENMKTEAERND